LPEEQKNALLFGGSAARGAAARTAKARGGARSKGYEGIVTRLEARLAGGENERIEEDDPDVEEGGIAADEVGRFLVTRTCDACKGRRLRPEALAVKLGEKDISQLGGMPLRHVRSFVEALTEGEVFSPRERTIAEPLLKAVAARLGFLIDVGLDYLTL